MKISLQELIEGQKPYINVNVDIELKNNNYLGEDISVVSPIHFEGKAENQSGELFLIGQYHCEVEFLCHRCLKNFVRGVSGSINERLIDENSEDTASEEYYRINKFSIDLAEILENAITLSLPLQVVCDEKCKGLCPVCGINLNSEECNCQEIEVDPRLAKLKELLQND